MQPVKGRPPRATTLWRSFGHAWDGLVDAAATQRNMRIHLVAGVLAGSFAAIAPLPAVERALIVLCTALVVAAEASNTSLEALVDLHGGAPSEPGRIAKDAAAGAVLALAVASVAVFALIVGGRWRQLIAGWRAVLVPGLAAVGLASLAGVLPLRALPLESATRALALAGVILITVLASTAACPPCVLVPAAFVAIAFGAGRRVSASGGSRPSAGV